MVPVPTSVSREAADALRSMVGDDGVPLNALHRFPAAEDRAPWKALKEAAEVSYARTITEAAGSLRSAPEELDLLGEVKAFVAARLEATAA